MSVGKERYYWRGKRVTEKIYCQRVAQRASGQKRKKLDIITSASCHLVDGRRIINISHLANNMKCQQCNGTLDLQNITREERQGLGSIFNICCTICNVNNLVPTDTQHKTDESSTKKRRFDVNSKVAMAALHTGMGSSHINKFFATLNMPTIDFKTFKKYEYEMGTAIEEVAKDSCHEWATVERNITIKDSERIQQLLPQCATSNFILPEYNTTLSESAKTPTVNTTNTPNDQNPEGIMAIVSDSVKNSESVGGDDLKATYSGVVRVAASYDMGYSTKGCGRTYDSKNGYGALLGRETGKAIDYFTTNRSCKKCSLGHPKNNHDCRLNFVGSAKAMEPFAAAQMTSKSTILKDLNIEIGILIGDDDSSTIAAVRAASKSQVIKLSDKNHTSRGLTNTIYKHMKVHKELKSDAVNYLRRCFTYAISQNNGNCVKIADALRNIPYHAFNNHSNCGDWCRYGKDPENYEHRVIKGGFQSVKLFEDLKMIYDKMADNVERFAAGASSQGNESLNATMTSHYPKSRCYSQTASGDFRFACAIGEKNLGERYLQAASKKRLLSPGSHTDKYINSRAIIAKRRYMTAKRPEFKRRRLFLREQRTSLRKKKEDMEGTQYESHMGLLSTNVGQDSLLNTVGINEEIFDGPDELPPSHPIVVYFDLETSGLSKSSDILQIAAQSHQSTFSVYINPIQKITTQASEANGLTNVRGELQLHGTRVPSIPLRLALDGFRSFLTKLNHPVILVAHNCKFDAAILITSIKKINLLDDFASIIIGFSDTLPIIKSVTSRKGKGECTLTGLASWLNISADGAHNAVNDVQMLAKIIESLSIPSNVIIDSQIKWSDSIDKFQRAERSAVILKSFIPIGNNISVGMKKKFAEAGIYYDDLVRTFRKDGDVGVKKLLGEDTNGNIRVSKSKKIISNVLNYLQNLNTPNITNVK